MPTTPAAPAAPAPAAKPAAPAPAPAAAPAAPAAPKLATAPKAVVKMAAEMAKEAAQAASVVKSLPPELHLGCFADFKEDRAAPYYLGQGSQMNTGKCNELAKYHGFQFFGLEQGKFGTQCWGTNEHRFAIKHSPSGAPADKCPIECPDDGKNKCGGKGHLSLYKTTPAAQYIGCFGDDDKAPTHGTLITESNSLTISKCMLLAKQAGYQAGDFITLKGGNKCYAEKKWTTVAKNGVKAGACKTPCSGDDRQLCGGEKSYSVIRVLALDHEAQAVADDDRAESSYVRYSGDESAADAPADAPLGDEADADGSADHGAVFTAEQDDFSALAPAERESWI